MADIIAFTAPPKNQSSLNADQRSGRNSRIPNINTVSKIQRPTQGLTPARRMAVAANILQELELLHADGAIATHIMNQMHREIVNIAAGYSSDPEPPLAS